MPSSLIQLEPTEFTPWNAPHLLTNQFQLLAKFLVILNANVPPEENDIDIEMLKKLELQVISVFSHQMMQSWLALAQSYYPFYTASDHDKNLIEALEQKLGIKVTDYDSLSMLIKEVFLAKYPNVNSQYQPFVDNIKKVIAKLTAVALSTPALINDTNQRDKKQFEGAGPSMANCINPIETILRHMMNRDEIDKSVIISATSLLLQVKAIKSHFEQITLIQKIESIERENKALQRQLDTVNLGVQNNNSTKIGKTVEEEQNTVLQSWQSPKEQMALVKVFELQKRVKQYYEHLIDSFTQSPKDKKVSAKLAYIILIKNDLDKETVLPSQRIETFEKQLTEAKEQLQIHRDPMWIRFLRDCLRILTFTLFGVAVYRAFTAQPVNFFKPSHGQIFVEEASCIISAHQEISLQP